ncbi:hypothetical protein EBBID32_19760 [Sphingobium indicum BiD32]|uniref:2OG-Fe dioxygenase family protein n=1 Tax=Sphingobium indicum BiD32 TaxID=1301087 RepID=N1MK91_9SPHN|nr:2OG-Fe dioxygenase family protein [Sphingobium indicum]CCW17635.1 hypothetical protein EBBID32_19760 [Sphingobium indicum BiD32]
MNLCLAAIAADVRRLGFACVPGSTLRDLLPREARKGWSQFAASWDDLGPDAYMADAGRYRRRRYAAYRATAATFERRTHKAHYQSRCYNRLNGGIERWFEPVTQAIADNPATEAILRLCQALFSQATLGETPIEQDVELHQFRIEAGPGTVGSPTPEGMHRDGVDWACVLLVNRTNIEHGVTHIQDENGKDLETVTLDAPLDTIFLDDRRVTHGVTDISRVNAAQAGFRDVLVITFRASSGECAAHEKAEG